MSRAWEGSQELEPQPWGPLWMRVQEQGTVPLGTVQGAGLWSRDQDQVPGCAFEGVLWGQAPG